MSDCGCGLDDASSVERKTLRVLLAINAAMFAVEAVAGWLGESTGLLADSLDMFADALVYGIGLYAVGGSGRLKANAAMTSGVLQIGLGLGVLVEVARRFQFGSEPVSALIIGVGALALLANLACLRLLAAHRDGEVHMRASWIFSKNDVIANVGVIVSGALVMVSGSRLPDLLIGALIAGVVVKGGLAIIRDARASRVQSACAARAADPGGR